MHTPTSININDNNINIDNSGEYDFTQEENIIKLHYPEDKENYECLFYKCSDISEIDLSNFSPSNIKVIHSMFSRCSNDLKNKIKEQNQKINENAFKEGVFLDYLSFSDSPLPLDII